MTPHPTPSNPPRLPTPGPEPIRPIVRRVIVAMPDEVCRDYMLAFLDDPYTRSLYGELVEP